MPDFVCEKAVLKSGISKLKGYLTLHTTPQSILPTNQLDFILYSFQRIFQPKIILKRRYIMNKKLNRSVKDKVIGGVAGGLAEYFEIDPVIVRVLL
jgi:hypothetical protein